MRNYAKIHQKYAKLCKNKPSGCASIRCACISSQPPFIAIVIDAQTHTQMHLTGDCETKTNATKWTGNFTKYKGFAHYQDCCAYCSKTPTCLGWNYNTQTSVCQIMSWIKTSTSATGFVSGLAGVQSGRRQRVQSYIRTSYST